MTNYIIDDSEFDFFKELSKISSQKDTVDKSECLLSKEPLTYNHIRLTCGHTFNYKPLFFEIYTSKYKLNTQSRNIFTIKCPYCRSHTGYLLPYIPLDECNKKIIGVNYPKRYCKQIHACSWKFTHGKNAGQCCSKSAYENENGIFCEKHHKMTEKQNKKVTQKDAQKEAKKITVTPEMNAISKKHTVKELRELLRSMNLRVGGTKNVLILRYLEALKA
jgi:hypothetical protein